MSSSSTIKRRRVDAPEIDALPSAAADTSGLLLDLPSETRAKIWEYLPKISVALFAAALTAPSSSWRELHWKGQPSDASKNVLASLSSVQPDANPWEIVDFSEVDTDPKKERVRWRVTWDEVELTLAERLNDGDIGALLVCIDAVNNVKRLKLTGCFGMAGLGLEPLSGSVVLEQIDLNPARQRKGSDKNVDTLVGSVSPSKVLPILSSIIEEEGNRLKQVQIPDEWRKQMRTGNRERPWMPGRWSRDQRRMVDSFFEQYEELLDSRPFNCSRCTETDDCPGTNDKMWIIIDGNDRYGVQDFTCYSCLENRCHEYGHDEDAESPHDNSCNECHRNYCQSCVPIMTCEICRDCFCEGCLCHIECEDCGGDFYYCRECRSKTVCKKCDNEKRDNVCLQCSDIKACDWCREKSLCRICRSACDFCEKEGCGNCDTEVLHCCQFQCDKANCSECSYEFGAVVECDFCGHIYCGSHRLAAIRAEAPESCFKCKEIIDECGYCSESD